MKGGLEAGSGSSFEEKEGIQKQISELEAQISELEAGNGRGEQNDDSLNILYVRLAELVSKVQEEEGTDLFTGKSKRPNESVSSESGSNPLASPRKVTRIEEGNQQSKLDMSARSAGGLVVGDGGLSGYDSDDSEPENYQLVTANTQEDQQADLQSSVANAIDDFGRGQAGLTRRPSIGQDTPFEATTKNLEKLSLNDPTLHKALDEVDSLEETRYVLASAFSRKEDGGKNQGILYFDESLVGGEDVAKEEALKALSILQAVVEQYNSKLEHGKDKITAERLAKMTLFADRNNGFGKVLAQIADDGSTYQRNDADDSIKRRDCYVADFMKVKNLEDKKSDIVINGQLDFRLAAIAQLISDDKEKESMVEALKRHKASDPNYVPPLRDASELIKQLSGLVTNSYANDAEQSFVQQRKDLDTRVDRLNAEIKERNEQIKNLNDDFRNADRNERLGFLDQIRQMKQEVQEKKIKIERFKEGIDEEQKKIAGQLTEAHDQESILTGKVNLILEKERELYEEYKKHKEEWKFSDEEIEFSAILQHVQKKLGIYSSQNKEYQDIEHDFRFNDKKLWGGKIADILAAIFPNEDWKSIDDEKVNKLIVFFEKVIDGRLDEIEIEVQASDLEVLELDPAETDTNQLQIESGSRSPYSGLRVEPAYEGVGEASALTGQAKKLREMTRRGAAAEAENRPETAADESFGEEIQASFKRRGRRSSSVGSGDSAGLLSHGDLQISGFGEAQEFTPGTEALKTYNDFRGQTRTKIIQEIAKFIPDNPANHCDNFKALAFALYDANRTKLQHDASSVRSSFRTVANAAAKVVSSSSVSSHDSIAVVIAREIRDSGYKEKLIAALENVYNSYTFQQKDYDLTQINLRGSAGSSLSNARGSQLGVKTSSREGGSS